MKTYTVIFKDGSKYFVEANTRFQALLKSCRRLRTNRMFVPKLDYVKIVNLSGLSHL